MKYLLLVLTTVTLTACEGRFVNYKPAHVGITPGMEWELQHGSETKYKPKVQASVDWSI